MPVTDRLSPREFALSSLACTAPAAATPGFIRAFDRLPVCFSWCPTTLASIGTAHLCRSACRIIRLYPLPFRTLFAELSEFLPALARCLALVCSTGQAECSFGRTAFNCWLTGAARRPARSFAPDAVCLVSLWPLYQAAALDGASNPGVRQIGLYRPNDAVTLADEPLGSVGNPQEMAHRTPGAARADWLLPGAYKGYFDRYSVRMSYPETLRSNRGLRFA